MINLYKVTLFKYKYLANIHLRLSHWSCSDISAHSFYTGPAHTWAALSLPSAARSFDSSYPGWRSPCSWCCEPCWHIAAYSAFPWSPCRRERRRRSWACGCCRPASPGADGSAWNRDRARGSQSFRCRPARLWRCQERADLSHNWICHYYFSRSLFKPIRSSICTQKKKSKSNGLRLGLCFQFFEYFE